MDSSLAEPAEANESKSEKGVNGTCAGGGEESISYPKRTMEQSAKKQAALEVF